MAGEFADKIGVFDFFVEVADESATGHVTAGDVGYAFVLGLSCYGVEDGDCAVYAAGAEDFFDGVVIFLL